MAGHDPQFSVFCAQALPHLAEFDHYYIGYIARHTRAGRRVNECGCSSRAGGPARHFFLALTFGLTRKPQLMRAAYAPAIRFF
jgi:hypothetical protein